MSENNKRRLKVIYARVEQLFKDQEHLTEQEFLPVTQSCQLPEYMNMTLFRKLASHKDHLTLSDFTTEWRQFYDMDTTRLFFNIIKKKSCLWICPEDFLPILEDIVMNHQGLNFLVDNTMFQERYIETVICKIFYDAKCYTGRMNLAQFRQSQFTETIQSLNAETDLNHVHNCFSYKDFYVLYCKFWTLDQDHDLLIYESDLLNYNGGILSEKLVHQIMQRGRIPAFSRRQSKSGTLTYLDYIWFLISEVDKSTPVAIEYWFRCLDEDGDGIITCYDLEQHWKDQEKRLRHMVEIYRYHFEEFIKFEDIMRQINDLVQPQVPGQFRLLDLKKNGLIAEKFFDTFINFDKFQIHDAYQTLYRANPHLTGRKNVIQALSESVIIEPFTLGSWYEYADQEYQYLVLNEQEDDWSIQLPEKEEKDTECDEEEAGSDSDNSTPSTPKLEPSSSQTDKETTQGKEEEEEEQEKNWIWNSVL